MRIASLVVALFALLSATAGILAGETSDKANSPGSLAAVVTADTASPTDDATAAVSTVRRSGSWIVEETANFSICRPASYKIKPGIAASFEALRKELCRTWQPATESSTWQPKCHIVVHPSLDGYLKEVGPGGRQTVGSSLVDFDKGAITRRRIDIRGDKSDWFTEAVAHEMTHIVLADRFIQVPIPHWADEGMAILADTAAKRQRHSKDMTDAMASGRSFRVAELLTLDGYPQPARMGAFYGQSASLVEFLVTLGTKEQLVDFVDHATVHGYDAALRKTYQIASVGDLEKRWRGHLRGRAPAERISASGKAAVTPVSRSAGTPARTQSPPRTTDMAAESVASPAVASSIE